MGIKYRTCDNKPNGKLYVKLAEKGDYVAKFDITDKESWTKIEAKLNVSSGVYPIYLEYKGEGLIDMLEIYFK